MKKVLIVEDAQFMRMTLRNMLERNGYEVIAEAENGAVGLQKYIECKPDIVTMDITMPVMGGIDALKAIKKIDSKAKVVMISSMGQEQFVSESVIYGAKTFIVKPFKEEYVIAALNKVAQM